MRRRFIIIAIVLIAVGKIFLAGGVLSLEGLQKCLSIDPSAILGPNGRTNGPVCMDDSMNYFVAYIIFLGAGAFTLVYGLKSKKTVKADA